MSAELMKLGKPADPMCSRPLGSSIKRTAAPLIPLRESSDCKSPSQNKHILKKKKLTQTACLLCLIKEGMNKNNPLPMRAFGKGSSWRWHRSLALSARSSLIGLWCLVGVSWKSGQDAQATWKGHFLSLEHCVAHCKLFPRSVALHSS